MSNAQLIVYFGITATLVIGALGELKAWLVKRDLANTLTHARTCQD